MRPSTVGGFKRRPDGPSGVVLTAQLLNLPPTVRDLIRTPQSRTVQKPPGPELRPFQRQVRLPAEQIAALVEAYASGASARELAEQYGVNESTVYGHLKRNQTPQRAYRKLRGDQLDGAIQAYESGQSLRSIAEQLGMDRATVRTALAETGVVLRR
jgi:DNA-binding CsgD family transcriptional regulator